MKRLINFGSIKQFRNVCSDLSHSVMFKGLDDNGDPIYDRGAKMPTVIATGSEKIHGTNAAVCYSIPDGFWVQSHKNIITPEKDNAGCALIAESQKEYWMKIINNLADFYMINLSENIISVYYEWCGGNIQKNSALSGLDKSAIIFQHFKVSTIEHSEDIQSIWYETKMEDKWVHDVDNRIYNIMEFPTYQIKIDFEYPKMSQNEMVDIVGKIIEPDSPVGNFLGIKNNIGEGIVWTFKHNGKLYKFKVKGEKHSNSKVNKLRAVDEVREQIKIDFVNYATSPCRLEQAWQTTFGINNEICQPNVKKTGDFLRAVHQDIIKEESDVMVEKGLTPKEVNGMISKIARGWFMKQLDEIVGL